MICVRRIPDEEAFHQACEDVSAEAAAQDDRRVIDDHLRKRSVGQVPQRIMITFDHGDARFTYRAAGVALHEGRVLLTTVQGFDFWFLPGGRCEFHEAATEALLREMCEEMGLEVRIERLLWVVENFFTFQGTTHHELGLYFLMSLPPGCGQYAMDEPFAGTEQSLPLIFEWRRLDELDRVQLFPAFLRRTLQALPATVEHIVHRD